MRKLFTAAKWVAGLLVSLLVVAVAAVLISLWITLPEVDGTIHVEGLGAQVSIARDSRGVPTIAAENREDAARALGFLHGQERFFQMDLLRRAAAGELSELFGPMALRVDRRVRINRFRELARQTVAALDEHDQGILGAYSDGVATGLSTLGARPFEYWLLRSKPRAWLPEDSILVLFAMWLDLQESNGEPDRSRAVVRDVFPADVAAFLLSPADPFQAAMDGSIIEPPPLPNSPGRVPVRKVASLPPSGSGPEDSSVGTRMFAALFPERDPDYALGSNNWAIAGSRTATGGALVASDMHLGLRMPHIWYRADIKITGGATKRITGLTLPGTPVLISGSNGYIAWGFTNSEIDTADIVLVETDPLDSARYLTPDGSVPFDEHEETIAVKGTAPETLKFRWTRWGPAIGEDHRGRTIALMWVAHQPGAANLALMRLEETETTADALRVARASGMPNQNFVVGDSKGAIGWTLSGRIPRREGMDGTAPISSTSRAGWAGWLDAAEVPQVLEPADGILWSANARTVGGAAFQKLGDGGYALASRSHQIRDLLRGIEGATPGNILAQQLDNRGIYLDFWQQLLVSCLEGDASPASSGRARMRELAVAWGGNAVVDSAGYRIVRDFRREVTNRVTNEIFARCRAAYPDFGSNRLTTERIVRKLVAERPPAWLSADHRGWDGLLLEAADAVITAAGGDAKLDQHTWGKFNRLSMRHPLSGAIPLAGRFLDMPAAPQNGDSSVINSQFRGHGSSQRMAVTPGLESEGILHIPGGQAGNPISRHYGDSHPDWARGAPTPFLPGPVVNNLLLTP